MSRLPAKPTARIMALVASSSPNPDRPRLPDEYERMLYPTDRARAACYAATEDLADKLATMAEQIDQSADDLKVVVDMGDEESWEENSLVTNIAALRGEREREP